MHEAKSAKFQLGWGDGVGNCLQAHVQTPYREDMSLRSQETVWLKHSKFASFHDLVFPGLFYVIIND